MSASKGGMRKWVDNPEFTKVAISYKEGDLFLWDLADAVESIVKKELAEKVEAMIPQVVTADINEYRDGRIRGLTEVLSLLTDTPGNEK